MHVRYVFNFFTGQLAQIPDSPVQYRTSGNPIHPTPTLPCVAFLDQADQPPLSDVSHVTKVT